MSNLVKAAEASLDIVEKYNLKSEDIQNGTIKLKASLDKVKEFRRNVARLQRVLDIVNAQPSKQNSHSSS